MTKRTLLFASLAVSVAIAAAALWAGSHLPRQMPLPVHWGLSGQPDRFAGKWTALLLPAGMALFVAVVFYFLSALEPRREGLERSRGLYLAIWVGLLILSALVELAVLSVAFKWSVHGTAFVLAGIGILFALMGNQLGKSRSMYLMGFRTPWTLANEEVWIRTHRLAGKLMVAGGLFLAAIAFLPLPSRLIAASFGAVIVVVLTVPFIYSYVLWRRLQQKDAVR